MASVAVKVLTIANGQTTSDAFEAASCAAFGLQLPGTFTGTAITFQVSADKGTTYQTLYEYDSTTDDGSATRATTRAVVQGRSYDLPAELASWTHFKIVSGSAEGAARTLVVVGKKS